MKKLILSLTFLFATASIFIYTACNKAEMNEVVPKEDKSIAIKTQLKMGKIPNYPMDLVKSIDKTLEAPPSVEGLFTKVNGRLVFANETNFSTFIKGMTREDGDEQTTLLNSWETTNSFGSFRSKLDLYKNAQGVRIIDFEPFALTLNQQGIVQVANLVFRLNPSVRKVKVAEATNPLDVTRLIGNLESASIKEYSFDEDIFAVLNGEKCAESSATTTSQSSITDGVYCTNTDGKDFKRFMKNAYNGWGIYATLYILLEHRKQGIQGNAFAAEAVLMDIGYAATWKRRCFTAFESDMAPVETFILTGQLAAGQFHRTFQKTLYSNTRKLNTFALSSIAGFHSACTGVNTLVVDTPSISG